MSVRSSHPLVPPMGWLGPVEAERVPLSTGFLVAATLLGALVRWAGLLSQSLWVDEIMTWHAVRPGAGLDFLGQVRDAVQGPLYLAVVWPLVRLADPELMLRLPAALAGALTVPVVGAVASRLLDRTSARMAVVLTAVNPFLVWYSQEARGYAFAVLFGCLMVLCFLRLQEYGPNRRDGVLFALASAATVWSNLSGLFLWAALAATLLLQRPRGSRALAGWGLAFAGGLVAALPWLLQAAGIWAVDRIVPGAVVGDALRGDTTFPAAAVPYALFSFFYGFSYGPSLRELHDPDRLQAVLGAWPWLIVGAAPILAGCVAGLARLDRRRAPLVLWIAVPFAVMALLALRNVKPWNARYVAVTVPWVLMLAAWGLAALPRRWGAPLTAVLCAAMLASLGGLFLDGRYAREDVRSAAGFVAAQPESHRPVLVPVVTGVWRFYRPAGGPVIDAFGAGRLRSAADADAFVAARLGGVDEAWYVAARTWDFDPHGHLVPALSRRGHLRLAAEFPGVQVYGWRALAGAEGDRDR